MEILFTRIRVAERPQSGDSVLGQILSISGAVVEGVGHLLLGVQPLIGGHGHADDDQRQRGGERRQDPQTGDCGV